MVAELQQVGKHFGISALLANPAGTCEIFYVQGRGKVRACAIDPRLEREWARHPPTEDFLRNAGHFGCHPNYSPSKKPLGVINSQQLPLQRGVGFLPSLRCRKLYHSATANHNATFSHIMEWLWQALKQAVNRESSSHSTDCGTGPLEFEANLFSW